MKLLLDKQIFASSDAEFCCDTRNDSCNTQNFGNFSLDMVFFTLVCVNEAPPRLEEPQGGTPPIHEKNFNV